MKTDPNDLAFPYPSTSKMDKGLTKREYFALHILEGLLSGRSSLFSASGLIEDAVDYADALIKRLNE